jgi:hypothetical protein
VTGAGRGPAPVMSWRYTCPQPLDA